MDGIRIVSLAYIHTTSDDQRSFFHLPASIRTPHRVRLLHPLCFHSPCCIATGGSQMALSLHSCPFSIVRCTRRLAGRGRALHPHPEHGSCTHYVLNLSHLHRVLPILSHIEPTFDVRLIASCILSPSVVPFMRYLMASHAFILLLCFRFLSPLQSSVFCFSTRKGDDAY
jgi:hypothetical protein